jgi:hypothetical protein
MVVKSMMTKQNWQRMIGAIGLTGAICLLSTEVATAATFNNASESGGVFGSYNALITTNGADNYTNLTSFVGLDVATIDGLTGGGEIFGGSAVAQTFFASAGTTLSFSWGFTGTPAPVFNDTAFIALNPSNGLQKLADTLSPSKSGSFSYLFPTSDTYSLRFGIVDVGDNSGVSQLQVSNLRVGSATIPTPALLPGLIGLGLRVLSKKRVEGQQES